MHGGTAPDPYQPCDCCTHSNRPVAADTSRSERCPERPGSVYKSYRAKQLYSIWTIARGAFWFVWAISVEESHSFIFNPAAGFQRKHAKGISALSRELLQQTAEGEPDLWQPEGDRRGPWSLNIVDVWGEPHLNTRYPILPVSREIKCGYGQLYKHECSLLAQLTFLYSLQLLQTRK